MARKTLKGSAPEQENLLYSNPASFSNFDLLAVLLDDQEKAAALVQAYPSLSELEDASAIELMELPTIGNEDVARILAARELSCRRAKERGRKGTPIIDCDAAHEVLKPYLNGEAREVVLALALDTKARLICPPIIISIGTINHALIHPREFFRPLIRCAAYSCVLAHFHPSSGEATPSSEDLELTAHLRDAGELLGIPVNDHLVIGDGYFVSLASRLLM